jgi:hypothetical protein
MGEDSVCVLFGPQILPKFGAGLGRNGLAEGRTHVWGSVGCSFRPSVARLDKNGPMRRIWGQRWRCSYVCMPVKCRKENENEIEYQGM